MIADLDANDGIFPSSKPAANDRQLSVELRRPQTAAFRNQPSRFTAWRLFVL